MAMMLFVSFCLLLCSLWRHSSILKKIRVWGRRLLTIAHQRCHTESGRIVCEFSFLSICAHSLLVIPRLNAPLSHHKPSRREPDMSGRSRVVIIRSDRSGQVIHEMHSPHFYRGMFFPEEAGFLSVSQG